MWSLSGSVARLETPRLQLRFDLRYPHRGLSQIHALSGQQTLVPAPIRHLFQVHLPGIDAAPGRVLESYVRGSDLVVNYGPTAAGEIQSQIYLRFIESSSVEAVGMEVIISVQTERLDSDPASGTSSCLSADELWRLNQEGEMERCDLGPSPPADFCVESPQGAFLLRLPATGLSYLEMVHPSDLYEARAEVIEPGDPHLRTAYRLFAEQLEKGVIRRGRLRGLLLPRQNDTRDSLDAYREFHLSTPPLTA